MISATEASDSPIVTAFERLERLETMVYHNQLENLPHDLVNAGMYLMLVGLAIWVADGFLPQMIRASQDIGIKHPNVAPLLAVIAAIGNFLGSPQGVLTSFIVAGLATAALQRLQRLEPVAKFIEKMYWMMPGMKDACLTVDRQVALEMLAAFSATDIDGVRALRMCAKAVKSPRFRDGLIAQALSIENTKHSLGESFATQELWGDDVIAMADSNNDLPITERLTKLANDKAVESKAAVQIQRAQRNHLHVFAIGAGTGVIAIAIYAAIIGFNVDAGQAVLQQQNQGVPSAASTP